jgi:hypothetical protein
MHSLPRLRPLSALRLSLAFAVSVLAPAALARTHLRISATGAAIDAFENWTSATAWTEIADFRNANAARPVIDLLLQLQALKAGGLDFDFEFVRVITNEQARLAVIEGRAQLTAETVWDDEIAAHAGALLRTDDILRNGEFVKGLYVLPTNRKMLAISSLDELRAASAAVVASWALDVKTLEAIAPRAIEKKPTPELVYQAIQKGQADFTLDEFSASADLSIQKAGVKLVPVPGCLIAIAGARSWIVAKADADAAAIHQALAAGAKLLRDNGTIERAYRESGFFNARVAGWKRLF